MTPPKIKVVVGLSGGVDSAIAAARLKAQDCEVTGLFMKNWEEDDDAEYCAAREDLAFLVAGGRGRVAVLNGSWAQVSFCAPGSAGVVAACAWSCACALAWRVRGVCFACLLRPRGVHVVRQCGVRVACAAWS